MSLRKASALIALSTGLFFAGVGAATAADDATVDCVASTDGSDASDETTLCQEAEILVAEPDATSEDGSVGSCWVTEDGSDICARSGVINESVLPTSEDITTPDCLNAEGSCNDIITDACDAADECPVMYSNIGGTMEKDLTASLSSDSSGYLVTMGLIASLLGGIVIALNMRTEPKKKK